MTELVYGYHPVREALRHRPHEIAQVWIARERRGRRRREIEELCRRHRVEVAVLPEPSLTQRVGGIHNGFAAVFKEGTAPGAPVPSPELVVLLEDIQDPRNLGALLRVCEGVGVGRVLIRDRGSAPLTPTVVKTSAGASEWLAVERIPNTAQALERLKAQGYWTYGVDPSGEPPWTVDLTGKAVFCFGGEERGLRARTRQVCDRLVGLPMRGRVESLNVASAAAAVLYEAVRQRSGLRGGGGNG